MRRGRRQEQIGSYIVPSHEKRGRRVSFRSGTPDVHPDRSEPTVGGYTMQGIGGEPIGSPPNIQARGFRQESLAMSHEGVEARGSDYSWEEEGFIYPSNYDGVWSMGGKKNKRVPPDRGYALGTDSSDMSPDYKVPHREGGVRSGGGPETNIGPSPEDHNMKPSGGTDGFACHGCGFKAKSNHGLVNHINSYHGPTAVKRRAVKGVIPYRPITPSSYKRRK